MFFLLLLPVAVFSAPVGHISIPFDARPGHVIKKLDWLEGQRSLVEKQSLLSKHFTVMNQGVLVTSQRITELAGWRIPLKIEHSKNGQTWSEEVRMYIEQGSEMVTFENQPYSGLSRRIHRMDQKYRAWRM